MSENARMHAYRKVYRLEHSAMFVHLHLRKFNPNFAINVSLDIIHRPARNHYSCTQAHSHTHRAAHTISNPGKREKRYCHTKRKRLIHELRGRRMCLLFIFVSNSLGFVQCSHIAILIMTVFSALFLSSIISPPPISFLVSFSIRLI